MERLIQGEYKMVAVRTTEFNLMKKAHDTAMTQEDTYAILDVLKERYALPKFNIRFSSKNGRAICKREENAEITLEMLLPSAVGKGYGNLRVGLVLHELAHIIVYTLMLKQHGTYRRGMVKPHGNFFIKIFDDLLRETQGLW